jgi:hypothetical protein
MKWMMPEMLPIPRQGMMPTLPSRTMYRYNTACAILPNPGLARVEAGIWGKDARGVPNGLSVRTVATAMPNQLALPCESRDHGPLRTGRRDCPNERT